MYNIYIYTSIHCNILQCGPLWPLRGAVMVASHVEAALRFCGRALKGFLHLLPEGFGLLHGSIDATLLFYRWWLDRTSWWLDVHSPQKKVFIRVIKGLDQSPYDIILPVFDLLIQATFPTARLWDATWYLVEFSTFKTFGPTFLGKIK